jgi:hypothetical protein
VLAKAGLALEIAFGRFPGLEGKGEESGPGRWGMRRKHYEGLKSSALDTFILECSNQFDMSYGTAVAPSDSSPEVGLRQVALDASLDEHMVSEEHTNLWFAMTSIDRRTLPLFVVGAGENVGQREQMGRLWKATWWNTLCRRR